ncbi:MAG: aldo/keto reductase [Acidobacteriota bacterium]
MKTRRLGREGPEVSALGLGCMAMSGTYGPADDAESVATIQEAIDCGITLLDTGDFYGMGHNEMLLRKALEGGRRERVFLQVKFGAQRSPEGAFVGIDTRPAAVKTFLAYSLRRLGTDFVDLYQPARLDPAVPIEETVGAIAELVRAGYVRYVGLSEMGPATMRRASAVHPITQLQIEYSLVSRSVETEVLPAARELGIGVTAYGVLSRGLLTGAGRDKLGKRDIRNHFPRFQGENLQQNLRLVEALEAVARQKGATAAQAAFAWVLSRGEDIIPLVGPRNRAQLRESLGALELKLTDEDLAQIEHAAPAEKIQGTRYAAAGMVTLDSEKQPGQA